MEAAIGTQSEVDRRNPTNLLFRPNSVIEQMEKKAAEESAKQQQQPILGLAAYIRGIKDRNRQYRVNSGAEEQILQQLRQSNSEYDPEMLSKIAAAQQNDIFMGMTGVKVRAADSWINDVLVGDRARNFSLSPTPIADLPSDVKQGIVERTMEEFSAALRQPDAPPIPPSEVFRRSQQLHSQMLGILQGEATKRCDLMATKIQDQFIEGGFYEAFEEAVFYAVRTLAGILKGPMVRRRPKPVFIKNPNTGRTEMGVGHELMHEWVHVHPLDFYPSEGMKSTDDGPTWERCFYGRSSLYEMIGSPGYSEDAIRAVLQKYGRTGFREHDATDTERAQLENRDVATLVGPEVIEGGEFNGCVPGMVLIEEGIYQDPDGKPIQPMRDYHISATMAAEFLIYHEVSTDPFYQSPYSKTGYAARPGSFWYDGVPKLMRDLQRMMNADMRALAKNMSMACLTGDTVVFREAQPRKYAAVTMQELFDKKGQKFSGLKKLKLRSLDEQTGEFFGNRVVDIVDNGIRDVFELLTERGYRIKATANHRFMREDGEWQHLEEFQPGDLIAVNGQKSPGKCIECGAVTKGRGVRCRACAMQKTHPPRIALPRKCIECGAKTCERGTKCRKCAGKNQAWNRQQIEISRHNRDAWSTTARGRFVCQSAKKDFCEKCGIRYADKPDVLLEVHHKDRSPWNNEPNNLQTLCSPCHHELHAYEDSLGDPFLHRYVSYDRIVSITHAGKERVFDLCMTGPNHNFIANGLVSHNSGPLTVINDINRLAKGQQVNSLHSWMVLQFINYSNSQMRPVDFHNVPSNAAELMRIFSMLSALADDFTGIPAYQYGNERAAGAGRTLGGLSMLMASSARGLKKVIARFDQDLVVSSIQRQFHWNMRYINDESIKGDARVVPRGILALIVKEQMAQGRLEFLRSTANPMDFDIMGYEGRAYVLRGAAEATQMDVGKIIPSDEKLRARELQRQQQPPPPDEAITEKSGKRA